MKNIKKFIFCLLILVTMFTCLGSASSQDCTYLFKGNPDIQSPDNTDLIYTNTKRITNLTQHFCENVKSLKCSDSTDGKYLTDYFDASQSIFLSILCKSVQAGTGYIQTNGYLKKKNFIDFGIVSSETGYQESCHRRGSMNNCDYSKKLPLIFNKIMNDFFSIKQARNLGITEFNAKFEAEIAANNFSRDVFPGQDMQNGICSEENSTYYKTTCKKLKGYMTDANNLLRNTEVIDITKLQAQDPAPNCENHFDENILYCGLLGSNSDYKFINTVYNEYFWYKVFLSYYSYYINGSDFLDNDGEKYNNYLENIEKNTEKIQLVQDQLLKSKQAITLSLQSLGEMSYAFPLHIGFLMYHEDAKYFIDNIYKIYTPIRTLYDKLRNVQIKEE